MTTKPVRVCEAAQRPAIATRHEWRSSRAVPSGVSSWHLFLMLTLALLAGLTAACNSSSCDGVVRDGKCEPLCADSDCPDAGRCVQNQCSLPCESNADCASGGCRSLNTDYGGRGKYCLVTASSVDPGPTQPPVRDTCTTSADCTGSSAQSCIDDRCVVTCLLHEHCGSIGSCTGHAENAEGDDVSFCQRDDFERGPGQYGWSCIDGNDDCDETADFHCLTSGEGDLDAYCVKFGCDADDDCPAGYFCNQDTFASLSPCEANCGLPADPRNPDCIPGDEIGEGRPFRCTEQGLQLRSCRLRDYCNECESDADCRGKPNQICARDQSGAKICTVLCDPLANGCPWGAASICAVHDDELGVATCGHRAGSCRGTGNSCDPCNDDGDCPYGFCTASSFSGERFCLDLRDRCSCDADAEVCVGGGCPMSPSGLSMNCVPLTADGPPEACYAAAAANEDEGSNVSCWPTP